MDNNSRVGSWINGIWRNRCRPGQAGEAVGGPVRGAVSVGGSVDSPCFTLIARMDKMPPYLVRTERGFGIEVYDTDSPMTIKLKKIMADYGIIDIKMRMLKISELKAIMGFPSDYRLIGTQAEQKKYIGNAVEVNTSKALCEALAETVNQ